jgi:hypothetical protein
MATVNMLGIGRLLDLGSLRAMILLRKLIQYGGRFNPIY